MEDFYGLELSNGDEDFENSSALFESAEDHWNLDAKKTIQRSGQIHETTGIDEKGTPAEARSAGANGPVSVSMLTDIFKNVFFKLDTNNNGYVSHDEMNEARYSDKWSDFSQNERLLINQLLKHRKGLQSLSNDEWGWERSGVTMADMVQLQKEVAAGKRSALINALKMDLDQPRLTAQDEDRAVKAFRRLVDTDINKGTEALKDSGIAEVLDKARAEGQLFEVGKAVKLLLPAGFTMEYTERQTDSPAAIHIWAPKHVREDFDGNRRAQNCYVLRFYDRVSVGSFRVDF